MKISFLSARDAQTSRTTDSGQLEFSRLPIASSTVIMRAELRISPGLDLSRTYAYSRGSTHEHLSLRHTGGSQPRNSFHACLSRRSPGTPSEMHSDSPPKPGCIWP